MAGCCDVTAKNESLPSLAVGLGTRRVGRRLPCSQSPMTRSPTCSPLALQPSCGRDRCRFAVGTYSHKGSRPLPRSHKRCATDLASHRPSPCCSQPNRPQSCRIAACLPPDSRQRRRTNPRWRQDGSLWCRSRPAPRILGRIRANTIRRHATSRSRRSNMGTP